MKTQHSICQTILLYVLCCYQTIQHRTKDYYTTTALNDLKEDTLMDMPALFEFSNHTYLGNNRSSIA